MLADQLDYIVGVDPHRDSHAVAVVEVVTGSVVLEATVAANSDGYADAVSLAEQHAPGRRAFAVEGTGSFGRGLTRFLDARGEWVLEVGRLRSGAAARPTRSTRSALPAACSVRSGLRRLVLAAIASRCRRWLPHAKAPSTPGRWTLSATRPADHHPGAVAERAAAADGGQAAAAPRRDPTRRQA